MKIRVIEVSKPQPDIEAVRFARHMKDAFKPYYIFSGGYLKDEQGVKYPMYNVVRLPGNTEMVIKGHESNVEREELLEEIETGESDSCFAP